jgi:tetratricopeptide (TPR) repeat protein
VKAALCALVFFLGNLAAAENVAPTVVPPAIAPVYAAAKAEFDAGNFAAAAAGIEDALTKLPAGTDGLALLNLTLGTSYSRSSLPEKSVGPLESAAKVFPDAVPLLADAYRETGRAEDAIHAYEKAATGDSTNARYSRARISELKSASASDPKSAATLLFSAADAFAELGEGDATYFAEATRLYERIARNRDWRGEATARAVFSLGDVERRKKALPEAIAYFQRCFVSWSRYTEWAAKAYIAAAESFEALGRRAEAKAHLFEIVRKETKYGKTPEFTEAKKRLRAWGETVP